MDTGNELMKFAYCLVHLAFIIVALLLRRRVFLVFGGFGVFGYLVNEAYTYFRYSVAFPFVLTIIGLAVIAGAIQYKKREKELEQKIASWLKMDVTRLGRTT